MKMDKELREKIMCAADNCIHHLCDVCPYYGNERGCINSLLKDFVTYMTSHKEVPLRCEKCTYNRCGFCEQHKTQVSAEDYCSLGAWSAEVINHG
jgi:hypothetical protein